MINNENMSDLESLKTQLNNAVNIANLGLWEWDILNDIVIWSDLTYDIYEVEKGTLINLGFVESLILEEDISLHKKKIAQCFEDKMPFNFEYTIQRNNKTKIILAIAEPIFKNGKIIKLSGVVQDITKRKNKEKKLEFQKKQYSMLIENMLNGVALHKVIWDEKGEVSDLEYVLVNQVFEEHSTLKRSEVIGKKVGDIFPDIQNLELNLMEIYAQVAKTAKSKKFEFYFEPLKKWFSISAYSPEPNYVTTVSEDITEKKLLEIELKESNKTFQKLTENIPTMLYQFNKSLDGKISIPYSSKGVEDIYEVSPLQLKNDVSFSFKYIHQDDIKMLEASINKSEETMEDWNLEYRVNLPKKGLRWLHGHSKPEKLEDGTIVWYGFVNDITEKILYEQKQTEYFKKELEAKEKLLHSEEEFNRFFQLSINLQLITTTAGLIMQINSSCKNIIGYENNELINTSFLDLVHPDDIKPTLLEMSKLSRGESVFYFENRYKHKNGTYVNLAWSATTDSSNNLIYATAQDITSLKRIEIENKEKERILYRQSKMAAMGEMIGNIAHQWRQPLSLISTSATGAKIQHELGLLNENNINVCFDTINNTAQYLSQTIDDFRGFFNPKNSVLNEFKILKIVSKSINLIKPQFISKDIEIIKKIEDIKLISIENELIQVLINILNNAKDALDETKNQKRLIFIKSYSKDNKLIIEIKDNAKGIPEDIIDRIFEPYFTTKHQSQGTGIGLYMCQEIIQTHLEGSISVRNEAFEYQNIKYNGANFVISIPFNQNT